MTQLNFEFENEKKREVILEALRHNVCDVTFTKVNGDIRTMPCTLQESYLPTDPKRGTKKPNLDVISVWSIDAGSWRSFRVDSVLKIEINAPTQDTWSIKVEADPTDLESVILPLPADLLEKTGWKEGDELQWVDNENGTFTLEKTPKE